MSASTVAGAAGTRPTPLSVIARIAVVLITMAALLSPLYAALRGLDFLNQPPPAGWGSASSTSSTSNSGGAGTSGSSGTSSGTAKAGFGGC